MVRGSTDAPCVGLSLDRDVNAARNILKRGLEIGLGTARIYAWWRGGPLPISVELGKSPR